MRVADNGCMERPLAGSTELTPRERELEYYDGLYSGFAQQHFAKPAVVAFRRHLVRRILRLTRATSQSRVLSIGSGTGDTEFLLAPHVASITGIDISARGVDHSVHAATECGITNASFLATDIDDPRLDEHPFDIAIGIFFLHHLPDQIDEKLPRRVHALLKPGGVFYALDPSSCRLSGQIGKLLVPKLMAKYQTEGEAPLSPARTWNAFAHAGFKVRKSYYDFASTPLAGLLPSWKALYLASRWIDNALVRVPLINLLSSNFEVLACRL